jgi:hypothetical protein
MRKTYLADTACALHPRKAVIKTSFGFGRIVHAQNREEKCFMGRTSQVMRRMDDLKSNPLTLER